MISDEQKLHYLTMQHQMYQQQQQQQQQHPNPPFTNYHPHHLLMDQYKNASMVNYQHQNNLLGSKIPTPHLPESEIPSSPFTSSKSSPVEHFKYGPGGRSPLDYVLSNLASMQQQQQQQPNMVTESPFNVLPVNKQPKSSSSPFGNNKKLVSTNNESEHTNKNESS
jgi:hypothetical protein